MMKYIFIVFVFSMALVIESLFYLKLSVGIHHIVYRYKAWPIFLVFSFVEFLAERECLA
jgi:hypothetical protein